MTDRETGVRIESEITRAIPRKHIVQRLASMMRRPREGRVTAQVFFTDVNGAKGGLDVRCVVRITLAGRAPIAATSIGKTPRLAFDAASGAVRRRFAGVRARRDDAARRPKKYFVARRLLL